MEILNLTPFAVRSLVVLDNGGKETLLVVVKATYALGNGAVRLADEQREIRMADAYRGEPGASGLEAAGETALFKPATDVILLGSAYPAQRGARAVDVVLQAGPIRKTVRAFGDRRWEGRPGSERIDGPLPFDRIPLIYEKAFGGIDDSDPRSAEAEPRNPVGIGFRAKNSRAPVAGAPLPNLEDPGRPIRTPADRPDPVGTGFVAPHWEPRRKRAGTFDERWLAERAPFLPDDHDPLFQQTAPADQICAGYLAGGEPVVVENASPSGRLSFRLPAPSLDVSVRMGEDRPPVPMRLDTVVIDGDAGSLGMVWRGSVPVHNRVYDVNWIRVAEAQGV